MKINQTGRFVLFLLSYVFVGMIFVLASRYVIGYGVQEKKSDDNTMDEKESTLVQAIEAFFGEWKIVEDLGYHGIHHAVEVDIFDVGDVIYLHKDRVHFKEMHDILFPRIVIEMTTSPDIESVDKILDPGSLGFTVDDIYQYYAKVYIRDGRSIMSEEALVFYILNDNEIILEGDVHRYYRAIRSENY